MIISSLLISKRGTAAYVRIVSDAATAEGQRVYYRELLGFYCRSSTVILSMVLDDNTLLQADATVIAGVLILLTIYSLRQKPSENTQDRIMNIVIAGVLITVIVPFSGSAMLILSPNQESAAVIAFYGFIYLFVGIVLMVLISRIPLFQKKVTGNP